MVEAPPPGGSTRTIVEHTVVDSDTEDKMSVDKDNDECAEIPHDDIPEEISQNVLEESSQKIQEEISQNTLELSQTVPDISQNTPEEEISQNVPETPQREEEISQNIPEEISQNIPEGGVEHPAARHVTDASMHMHACEGAEVFDNTTVAKKTFYLGTSLAAYIIAEMTEQVQQRRMALMWLMRVKNCLQRAGSMQVLAQYRGSTEERVPLISVLGDTWSLVQDRTPDLIKIVNTYAGPDWVKDAAFRHSCILVYRFLAFNGDSNIPPHITLVSIIRSAVEAISLLATIGDYVKQEENVPNECATYIHTTVYNASYSTNGGGSYAEAANLRIFMEKLPLELLKSIRDTCNKAERPPPVPPAFMENFQNGHVVGDVHESNAIEPESNSADSTRPSTTAESVMTFQEPPQERKTAPPTNSVSSALLSVVSAELEVHEVQESVADVPSLVADTPTPAELGRKFLKLLDHKSDASTFSKVSNLLKQDADPNVEDAEGRTCLMFASKHGDGEECGLLLEKGASVNHKCFWGYTPLTYAVKFGTVDVCRLLLDKGADLTRKDDVGSQYVLDAVTREDTEICRLLLDRGADMGRYRLSLTPLERAASNGSEPICRLLIEYGANTDLPLYYAAKNGRLNICTLLLEEGADVMARGDCGETCLHAAAEGGSLPICCLLLKHGVNVDAVNKDGRNALDLAKRAGHTEVADMLQEFMEKKAAETAKAVAHSAAAEELNQLKRKWEELAAAESRDREREFEVIVRRLKSEKETAEERLKSKSEDFTGLMEQVEQERLARDKLSMQTYSGYDTWYQNLLYCVNMMIGAKGGSTGKCTWPLTIERASNEKMALSVLDKMMHVPFLKTFFKTFEVKMTNAADQKGRGKKRKENTMELGIDAGGLTNDLLGKVFNGLLEIKVNILGNAEQKFLFAGDENAAWSLPLEDHEVTTDAATLYEGVGRLFLKAILSGANTEAETPTLIPDAIFNPCFIHMCLDRGITKSNSGNCMMSDEDVGDALDSVLPPGSFGLWSADALIAGGATMDWATRDEVDSETLVTHQNYNMYRRKTLEHILGPRKLAFEHMKKGFLLEVEGERHGYIPPLKFFNSKQLKVLFCGKIVKPELILSTLNFVDGNHPDETGGEIGHMGDSWAAANMRNTKQWLLEYISKLDAQECEDFLNYCAAVVRIPYAKSGEPDFQIHVIARGGSEPRNALPSAQTCFRKLSLPAYTTYNDLQKAFKVAFKHAGGYFGKE